MSRGTPVCGEVRAFETSQPDSGELEVFIPIPQGARVPCIPVLKPWPPFLRM